ncbi:MAG: FtsX-like permease family protein [Clostridium sp.]|uniref:FtsX-like permease family protein n=1 Tax=Clostridium sp. TaxID=1506 RepID=UPI0030554559
MLNYIFKSIRKYKGSFIFMIVGIFTIFSCIPVGIASLYTSKAIVTEDISKYGRGQYDILVRPEGSITEIEKEGKLIEEIYAHGGNGGISLEDYETIKGIPGIEVVAPVATLGYFADANSGLSIVLPRDDSGYKISMEYKTSDGIKDYLVESGEMYAIPTIRKNIATKERVEKNQEKVVLSTELRENGTIEVKSNAQGIDPILPYCLSYGVNLKAAYPYGKTSNVFYGKGVDEYDAIFYKGKHFGYEISMPRLWSMLVAIDPKEESKLVGLDKYIAEGQYLNMENNTIKEDTETFESSDLKIKTNKIPIIRNTSATYPFNINVKLDKLDINRHEGSKLLENNLGDLEQMENYDTVGIDFNNTSNNPYLDKKESTYNEISNIKVLESGSKNIDLTEYLSPFNQVNLIVDPENNWTVEKGKTGEEVYQGTKYYTSTPLEYSKNEKEISLKSKDAKNNLLIFRNLEEHGSNVKEVVERGESTFKFDTIGTFDGEKMYNSDEIKLNGSPLGIYGDSYLKQVEDSKGNKVDNKKIYPTSVPGSLASSVPQGYTTLEAATLIKGDKPIDSVRVRIADIDKYDENAKNKIQQIAMQINEKTGHHVDVVAGSSTQNIVTTVEGIDGVDGLGKILQRWVTLGTALKITNSWDAIGFILVVLFVICGVLFVINRISSYLGTRSNEIIVLKNIGWDNKQIAKVIAGESFIASLISTLLVVITTVMLTSRYEIKFLVEIVTGTLIIGNILVVVVSYIYALVAKSKTHSSNGNMFNKTVNRMVVNEVIRNKGRYILTMAQIALSGGLGIFTYMSLQATRNNIGNTALGNQVNLSTGEMSLILTIGAFALIIFTTFDRFSSIVENRKREIVILSTLGWDSWNIGSVVYGSLILVAAVGNAVAFILSLSFYKVLYSELPMSWLNLVLLIILMIGVSVLSGIFPLIKATKSVVNDSIKDNR